MRNGPQNVKGEHSCGFAVPSGDCEWELTCLPSWKRTSKIIYCFVLCEEFLNMLLEMAPREVRSSRKGAKVSKPLKGMLSHSLCVKKPSFWVGKRLFHVPGVVQSLPLSLVRSQRNTNTLPCQHQLPRELRFPGSREPMRPCPRLRDRGSDQLAKLRLGSLLRRQEGIRDLLLKNCPSSLSSRKKLAGGGRCVGRCLTRHPEETLFPADAVPRADTKSCLEAPGNDSPTKQTVSAN